MNTNTIKNSLLCCFLGVAYCYTNLAIACSGEGGKAAVISQNQTLSTQNKLQKYLENFQISGALGVSQLSANNGIFLFMPDELDTIRTDRATRSLNFKAGIGYNLFSEKLSQNRFLNNLLVELNFYRFSGSAYGNVYQFGDPASDDIRFTLNIDSSKRIMLDIKPSLFTWRGL